MRPYLTFVAINVFLSSCAFTPDYIRPNFPVEEAWPDNDNILNISSTEDTQIKWRDFFQSSSLQLVIQEALTNNRDLRVAILNIEAARAAYRIERANLLPSLDIQAVETRQFVPAKVSVYGKEYIETEYNANLASTAYEVDLFGRVRSINEAALETYLATEEARKATQITLIAETANSYLQWLSDRAIFDLVNNTLIAQQRNYDIIKVSYEQGIASKLDLAQAQITLENARANKSIYARMVEQDKNALFLLMGSSNQDIISTDDTLDKIKLIDQLPIGLPSEILLARPDVQQAEHQLKAQNANIGAARAAFFPLISLTGTYGFSSNSLTNLFIGGSTTGAWSFAPQITMPIFDAGKNFANLDSAKVAQKIAIANYEKTIQSAFREVADALAAQKTLTKQLEAQTELMKAAQNSYDLAYSLYKAGINNYTTVLISQQSLFTAEQNQISVKQQQLANLINLYKALGGGSEE